MKNTDFSALAMLCLLLIDCRGDIMVFLYASTTIVYYLLLVLTATALAFSVTTNESYIFLISIGIVFKMYKLFPSNDIEDEVIDVIHAVYITI